MQAEALDAAEAAGAAGAAEAAERAKVGTLNMYQLECVRGGAAFVRGDDGHGTTAQEAYRLVDQKVLDARTYTMNKSSRLLEIMKDPSVLERAEEEFKQYPYPLTRTQQQPMTFPIDYKRSMPR